jgi:hypothetical protein
MHPSGEYKTGAGQDPLIGRVLNDRYRILDVIGVGGMAKVYTARRVVFRRPPTMAPATLARGARVNLSGVASGSGGAPACSRASRSRR